MKQIVNNDVSKDSPPCIYYAFTPTKDYSPRHQFENSSHYYLFIYLFIYFIFQYSYPSHGGFLAGVVRQNKTIKSGLQAYGLKQTRGCEID